ncbi:acyltransferase family protein [Lentzea flaviverrucosa]|uniref:Peptidoglycan/LPS O-acetylase OafA/YrhL, contains acyltransferase and SGNH-hydrolase domains n=1 Tax=Lentzea flaviverrucosa TaxID=200379 RepID=A0A1H9XUM9_9PSEU|nr:acyltransferase [Lentzea flaviverrucosa]RDI18784.1 peptidoglycan/LPS O-acetylase OafA/YrhL [Lentzea flaviverrucosa]SES49885.1 Peptidoglycan/LPS O-acetylase OafA/YrhL, contains acyltransferase and SGNH-hydrolase domains [Lentzea flaviverrucosa]
MSLVTRSVQRTAADQAQKTRVAFVDIGRAVAALLVVYSHLSEQWVAKVEGDDSPVFTFVDALTSDPMHMGLQGIGQIAVPFFFLVSGFVVTPIAMKQGQGRFAANRAVRVYIPMIFVVLLTALVMTLGADAHAVVVGRNHDITLWTIVTNSLVINYLIVPQVVLVGVAWTLVVEVIFYILLVLLLPVLRRQVWLAIAIMLVFVFVVLMSRRELGPSWALFAVNVSYLPIPILGQIIWATTTKRIPLWAGGVFFSLAWSLYVLGEHLKLGRLDSSYNLALMVAVLCFFVGLFAEPRLRERKIWTALSERSYSIYLLHGLVAFGLLSLMRPALPLWLAMPLAVAGLFLVVEVSYRLVEKPSHVLARKLSRRSRPAETPSSPQVVTAEVTVEIPRLRERAEPSPSLEEETALLPRVPAYPSEDPDDSRRRRRLEDSATQAISVASLLAKQEQNGQRRDRLPTNRPVQ